MGIVDELEQARQAFERRDWAAAYERLSSVDDLGPDDLMTMGTAAYLAGDDDACIRAFQRGYQSGIAGGDTLRAVRFAFWLGLVLNARGEAAVASGWVGRAQRLLADQPDDVVERGYLLIHDFFRCLDRQGLRRGVARRHRDGRAGPAVRERRPGGAGPGLPGPPADLLRPGPGGPRAARRGDGRGRDR
jgi:hypothetical protein